MPSMTKPTNMITMTECCRAFNSMPWLPVLLLTLLLLPAAPFSDAFAVVGPSRRHNAIAQHRHMMGPLDSIISNFFQDRGADFVRLETTDTFGPGPALILYDVPAGIANDEIQDMVSDGAPRAYRKGVTLARLSSESPLLLLNLTVADALEQIVANNNNDNNDVVAIHVANTRSSSSSSAPPLSSCPILYFSGFDNKEMMAVYQLLGKEVFDESGASPACAKAVPNAMMKTLQQVLEEISGDHSQASGTTAAS